MRAGTVPTDDRRVAPASRLRDRAARLAAAVRAVLGVPDYERYLAHARTVHPESRPMSRDEFVAVRTAARYERPGSRCW
jgi:uncharacterized short protein YbdD (DUF466 family)